MPALVTVAVPLLAKRRAEGLDDMEFAPGYGIKRNPGAVGVWTTLSYKTFKPQVGNPGILFELGEPEELRWFANGRVATDDEDPNALNG